MRQRSIFPPSKSRGYEPLHALPLSQPHNSQHEQGDDIQSQQHDFFTSQQPTRHVSLISLSIFVFLVLLSMFVFYTHHKLPDAKMDDVTPADEFSAERAFHHLSVLTAHGPRETGSFANEFLTPAYILHTLSSIRASVSNPLLLMEVDVQRASGSFDLEFLGGFTSEYQNITNIVVKMKWLQNQNHQQTARKTQTHHLSHLLDPSLLVSAHYDSALGTVAVSDNLANVCILLELIRALAQRSSGPSSSLIFLLTGAEETILQGSHGFITQHRWASQVSTFINLEGAGGFGRELVFQTGPQHSWLAYLYSQSAPYPFASILGQDVFQSGIIPSDTDFRIFRDWGHIPGIDIAYIGNGYIYHTALDDLRHLPLSSLQHTGDNLLQVVDSIANSPYLVLVHKAYNQQCNNTSSQQRDDTQQSWIESILHNFQLISTLSYTADELHALIDANQCTPREIWEINHDAIYFDLVGITIIIYSTKFANFVNITVIFISSFYILHQHLSRPHPPRLLLTRSIQQFFVLLLSILCGIVCPMLIAAVLMLCHVSMSWFTTPLLLLGLYAIPSFLAFITVQHWFYQHHSKHLSHSLTQASPKHTPKAVALAINESFINQINHHSSPKLAAASVHTYQHQHDADKELSNPALNETSTPLLANAQHSTIHSNLHAPSDDILWLYEEQCFSTGLMFWLLLLIFTYSMSLGSAFLPMLWCSLPLTTRCVYGVYKKTIGKEKLMHNIHSINSTNFNNSKGHVPPTHHQSTSPSPSFFHFTFHKGWCFMLWYVVGLCIPTAILLQSFLVTFSFFLPLMGRAGTEVPSDLVVSALVGAAITLLLVMYSSIMQLNKHWKITRAIIIFVFIITIIIAFTTATPYSHSTPKRVFMQHVLKLKFDPYYDSFSLNPLNTHIDSMYDSTRNRSVWQLYQSKSIDSLPPPISNNVAKSSGLWLLGMDSRNIDDLSQVLINKNVLGLTKDTSRVHLLAQGAQLQCPTNSLFCNMPFYLPLKHFVTGHYFLPAKAPSCPTPTLRLLSSELLRASTNHRRLHFLVEHGSDHMALFINNRGGFSKCVRWSFGESVKQSEKAGRATLGKMYEKDEPEEFFIYFASGTPVVATQSSLHKYFDAHRSFSSSSDADVDGAPSVFSFPPSYLAHPTRHPIERAWYFWLELEDNHHMETIQYPELHRHHSKYFPTTPKQTAEIAVAVHFLQANMSKILPKIEQQLPDWITPISFTSVLLQYQF